MFTQKRRRPPPLGLPPWEEWHKDRCPEPGHISLARFQPMTYPRSKVRDKYTEDEWPKWQNKSCPEVYEAEGGTIVGSAD